MKLKITVNGKDCYMDEDAWKMEQAWRKQREKEVHKSMVEFFKRLDNEANNSRKLRVKSC